MPTTPVSGENRLGAGAPSLPRNHKTAEGRELGRLTARLCDEAEPAARLKLPELPPRCNSCAFREGPHLASSSPYTQMDAIKCVMEGVEFNCHEPAREGHICSGWAMMMLAKDDPDFREVPWPFTGADQSPTPVAGSNGERKEKGDE